MEILQKHVDGNADLVKTIEYLIKDGAFDSSFLTTAVLEYCVNNKVIEDQPL